MAIPILTYHAANVLGNDYANNDHVALADDLQLLQRLGLRIIGLDELVAWQRGGQAPGKHACVALSFDDGTDFDFHDLPHPDFGMQRSFANILRDHQQQSRLPVSASAFVIASPEARRLLDQRGLIGKGWWNDDWWLPAQREGLLSIECHSWDHLHPDLDEVTQRDNRKGDFSYVDCFDDCEGQLRQAADYLATRMEGRRPRYFAYPWGQSSDYLAEVYLPKFRSAHGFEAAFTTEPEAVTRAHSRWRLPRFVCGRDWRSPQQLADLLGRVQAA